VESSPSEPVAAHDGVYGTTASKAPSTNGSQGKSILTMLFSYSHTLLMAPSHRTYTPPAEFSLFVLFFFSLSLDEEKSWKLLK